VHVVAGAGGVEVEEQLPSSVYQWVSCFRRDLSVGLAESDKLFTSDHPRTSVDTITCYIIIITTRPLFLLPRRRSPTAGEWQDSDRPAAMRMAPSGRPERQKVAEPESQRMMMMMMANSILGFN